MAALLALALATLPVRVLGGPTHSPLTPGPGAGYRTQESPMVRPRAPAVTVTPILTAGDTLYANDPGTPPFIFPGRAEGLALRDAGNGLAELFVSHSFGWLNGAGGGLVSRLLLDPRSLGVIAADYVIEPEDRYALLRQASIADGTVGFLKPTLLLNEGASDGPRRGVVAAVDTRNGTVQDLPWLGRGAHKSAIVIPVTRGSIVAVSTMGRVPGQHQIYLYIANSDADFLAGAGRLYVLRSDSNGFSGEPVRGASDIQKNFPVEGAFLPIDPAAADSPQALEIAVQRAGCLNFDLLEGLAVDRERLDAFYVTDAGGIASPGSFPSSAGSFENGRLYHVVLDPIDPTRVPTIEVLLDGSRGDDLYHPAAIATDQRCVMILENPGSRGIHPARIMRYDTRSRRLDALAECAELDRRGRALPEGTGGDWRTTGILNASDLLGEDSWFLAVQARTLRTPQTGGRWGEAGQILLLRGDRYPRRSVDPRAPEKPNRSEKDQ